MFDPETSAERFRAEAFDVEAIGRAIRQPPLDDLCQAATKRRQRRVSTTALVAVFGLLGIVIVPLSGGPSGYWTGPKPTASAPVAVHYSDLYLIDETSAVAVRDAWCWVSFAITEDGGRTWSDWRSLRPDQECRMDERGDPTSHSLAVSVLHEHTFLVTHEERRYLTHDAGRTWSDARAAIVPVDSFPPTAEPVSCQIGCLAQAEALAVDRSTATVYRLTGEPPSPYPLHYMYVGPDGSLWASYARGHIDDPTVVAWSADRGATWQSYSAPVDTYVTGLAAVDRLVAYLLLEPRATDEQPATDGVRSRLLRTTDGGATWTDIDTDLPSTTMVRPITLGSDGTLLVGDATDKGGFLWSSRDGGRHFEAGPVTTGAYFNSTPGRIWLTMNGAARVSTDGTNWTTMTLPR
nr:hypothetical protein [Micromonospora sp. DSM 115978]